MREKAGSGKRLNQSFINQIFYLALLLSISGVLSANEAKYAPPRRLLFNEGWKFSLATGKSIKPSEQQFDDSRWRNVDLPHDYSIEGKFDSLNPSCAGYLPGGSAWYRKTFAVAAADSGNRVVIDFDGVYKNSEAWINGHYLGKHSSGYTSFQFEVSKWLLYDRDNVIVIRSDHDDLTDSGWYTGSGIYRNVFIQYTSPIYIPTGGVFVTTPAVNKTKASFRILVPVIYEVSAPAELSIGIVINDLHGVEVFRAEKATGKADDQKHVIVFEGAIANPLLWSVSQPHLYAVHTTISSGSKLLDQSSVKFGIRTLLFDPENGFFLNGISLKMKGVCMVHDAGVLGAAVPKQIWLHRLDLLKQMGCNAIRACHNPHSTDFLDACDEKGFLVIAEAYDEWEQPKTKWVDGWNQSKKVQNGYYKYFKEFGKTDLRDQILRDRNHPSIVLWSIGNEIDFPNDPYSHPSLDSATNPQAFAKYQPSNPRAERLAEIAAELVAVVKQSDTTRPVTAGLASAFMSHEVGFAQQLDVLGYNYQEGLFATNHQRYPGKPFYASESGFRLAYWDAVNKNEFVTGQFLWTGFEYLGESFKWPQRTNPFGIIDLGGHFKPEAYFRQSLWSDSPMVYIGAWDTTVVEPTIYHLWDHKNALPHWNWPAGRTIRISSFTNCEAVELFINGKSVGSQQMENSRDRVLNWFIPFVPGVVEAVARTGGKEMARYRLQTTATAASVGLTTGTSKLSIVKHEVAIVEVSLLDKNGRLVYLAANDLTVDVAGPAKIIGIENSDPTDTSLYRSLSHHAYNGRITVYVQATSSVRDQRLKPGLRGRNGRAVQKKDQGITLTVSGKGLKPATLHLEIEE